MLPVWRLQFVYPFSSAHHCAHANGTEAKPRQCTQRQLRPRNWSAILIQYHVLQLRSFAQPCTTSLSTRLRHSASATATDAGVTATHQSYAESAASATAEHLVGNSRQAGLRSLSPGLVRACIQSASLLGPIQYRAIFTAQPPAGAARTDTNGHQSHAAEPDTCRRSESSHIVGRLQRDHCPSLPVKPHSGATRLGNHSLLARTHPSLISSASVDTDNCTSVHCDPHTLLNA
jgi:hypothetical protein